MAKGDTFRTYHMKSAFSIPCVSADGTHPPTQNVHTAPVSTPGGWIEGERRCVVRDATRHERHSGGGADDED